MEEENAFYLMPVTAYDKTAVIVVSFTIDCPDPKMKEKADAELKSKLPRRIFSNTSAARYSVFSALCNNISEVEEINRWVHDVRGVGVVTMGIVKDVILVPDWLDELVDKRILDSRAALAGK